MMDTWLPLGVLLVGGLVAVLVMRVRKRRARPERKGIDGERFHPTLFV